MTVTVETNSYVYEDDPINPSDAELVQATQAGDAEAFGKLYASHIESAKNFATYLCGDAVLAEDIAQDAFVRTWGNIGNIDLQNGSFNRYLNRVVRNLIIDTGRSQTRRKTDLYSNEDIPEPPLQPRSLETTAVERLDAQDRLQAVRDKIGNPEFMEALVNVELGVSDKELAEATHVSIKTIRTRRNRARKMLGVEPLRQTVSRTAS